MVRTRHLFEADSAHSSLKEYDPSAVSGTTKTPVSNFVQLTMNGSTVSGFPRRKGSERVLDLLRSCSVVLGIYDGGFFAAACVDEGNAQTSTPTFAQQDLPRKRRPPCCFDLAGHDEFFYHCSEWSGLVACDDLSQSAESNHTVANQTMRA